MVAVDGPVTPPAGCNVTDPAVVDANLRIVGNLIWNGGADLALGLGDTGEGGQTDNPTCNPTLVLASNLINQVEPPLVDPEHGDYRVRAGANLGMSLPAIPPFPGDDRAQPPPPCFGLLKALDLLAQHHLLHRRPSAQCQQFIPSFWTDPSLTSTRSVSWR